MSEAAAVLETRSGKRPLSARTLDALDLDLGACVKVAEGDEGGGHSSSSSSP